MVLRKLLIMSLTGFFTVALHSAPRLEISRPRIALGDFAANEPQSAAVSVNNSGDEKLVIDSIRSTCGCTVGTMAKSELQPGESTDIEVRIIPESISGPFSKALFIKSNDPRTPLTSVYVSGNSIPLVRVLPQNNLYAGTLEAGKEWSQQFLLESNEKVVWGEIILPSGNQVKAELKKQPEQENRHLLTLKITPDPAGEMFRIELKLPISEPAGWQPVEILIFGRIAK